MSEVRLRLFFALWPDDQAALAISRSAAALLHSLPGRKVARERLHLTLSFLGSRDSRDLGLIEEAAAQVKGHAFRLTLDQAGLWRRAGVAWLAPSLPPPELVELSEALSQALAQAGFEPETRAFRPHVTIARKVRRARQVEIDEPPGWQVEDFRLVQSVTRATGPQYTEIGRWPLAL